MNRTNTPIGYNDTQYPYFKTGVYREAPYNATFCNKTVYYDVYKIMNSTGNYSAVDPSPYKNNASSCMNKKGVFCDFIVTAFDTCHYNSVACIETNTRINYTFCNVTNCINI